MFLFSKSRIFPRSNKTYKQQNFIPHLYNLLRLPSICSTHTTVPPNPTSKLTTPYLSAKSIHYTPQSHNTLQPKNHLKNPIKPHKQCCFSMKRICKNTVMFHVKHCPYYIIIPKIKTFQKSVPNQIFHHHLKSKPTNLIFNFIWTQIPLSSSRLFAVQTIVFFSKRPQILATPSKYSLIFYFFANNTPVFLSLQPSQQNRHRFKQQLLINQLIAPRHNHINICHIRANTHRVNIIMSPKLSHTTHCTV